MKKRTGKWEACIAKSTVPKGARLTGSISYDTWYPIISFADNSVRTFFWISTNGNARIFTGQKDSAHLGGGNFKIRRVKEER